MTVLYFTGLLLGSGLFLCHLANRQYEALPPHHPHRFKYGTGYHLPVQTANGVTTYQLPPGLQMANQAIPTVTIPAGHTGPYPQQAPAAPSVSYPTSVPPAGVASYPAPGAWQYKDDPPPPYSAVVTNDKRLDDSLQESSQNQH